MILASLDAKAHAMANASGTVAMDAIRIVATAALATAMTTDVVIDTH